MTPRRPSSPSLARLLGEGPTRRLELPLLAAVPGLVHAFTVLGSDTESVLRASAGARLPLRTLRQVHGATVRVVDGEPSGATPAPELLSSGLPEGDALVSARPGIALGVWVADCAPILICDPRTRALAAVHAGWRGTVARVLGAAIARLRDVYGARPRDLHVAIGPAIGRCCFEVGEEVVRELLRADPGATGCVLGGDGEPRRIDLIEANRRQAIEAGVPAPRIEAAGLCTRCRDDLLESYRRNGRQAGRMAGMIAWRP